MFQPLIIMLTFYFLVKANYYVIFPTAHIYSRALGSKRFAAALIGVANVSSLVGMLCLSLVMSKRSSPLRRRLVPNDFRLPSGKYIILILCEKLIVANGTTWAIAYWIWISRNTPKSFAIYNTGARVNQR